MSMIAIGSRVHAFEINEMFVTSGDFASAG